MQGLGLFVYGMRSRSPQVAQDTSCMTNANWDNMPPEILREVLMRIEASDDKWPPRRNVVACAGVCKNWREMIKQFVKSPQVSGTLTFPISLKQPGPKGSFLRCYIKRSRRIHSRTYYLYLAGVNQASTIDGKFLLAARKCRRTTGADYIISLNSDNVSKGNSGFVGKLRSNFLGSRFTIYDAQPSNTKWYSERAVNMRLVSHIAYDISVLGNRCLRRMRCVLSDDIPAPADEPRCDEALTQTELVDLNSDNNSNPHGPVFRGNVQSGQSGGMLVLRNKAPRWHEQLQGWCLNFSERVSVPSVKNFQLVDSPENGVDGVPEHENVILEFGRVGKNVYTMDYQYPISAFQAFAICLSSFDTKISSL